MEEKTLEGYLDRAGESETLAQGRRRAWDAYEGMPMPTRKTEEWRYTDISGIKPGSFTPLVADTPRSDSVESLPPAVQEILAADSERDAELVEVNGTVVHRVLSDELVANGVRFAPIAEIAVTDPEILAEYLYASSVADMEAKLWSLHVALLTGGYVLHIPADVDVSRPIHTVRYLDRAGALISSHSLIVAGPGARVAVIDEYVSPDLDDTSLSLNGVEIYGAENAAVSYLSLQRYGRGIKHFSMQHSNTRRDASLSGFNVTLGADLSRADVTSHLEGPGASAEMLALWFGARDQHFDHHTLQHHEAPSAHSDLLYKGALTEKSRSVFRGLIRVSPGAQLTDAYQTNRNLLLSPDASATALPNLEIEADDVRCSHGATVGQVDETQLFYLMSRGLSREQAERLLVFGFFDEVLVRVPMEGVRDRIRKAIERKVGLGSGAGG